MDVRSHLKKYIISVHTVTVLVAVVAVLLYGFKFPIIVSDMAWYISHACSLLQGYGLAGPDLVLDRFDVFRGPVFPALIAIALSIDFSPEAAFWVVKISSILLPPTIFLFCYQLQSRFNVFPDKAYGVLWGITATIGLFSIAEVNNAIEWHIDAWWILFCLWSLMSAINAFATQSVVKGVGAGVLLSIGFLTKETSILYLIVLTLIPVVIPSYRTPRNLVVLIAVVIAAAIPVGTWFYYLDSRLNGYEFLGAQGGSVAGIVFDYIFKHGEYDFLSAASSAKDLFALMVNNRSNGVLSSVPYGGILLIAWLVYGVRAVKFSDSRVIVLASGVALPLLAYNAIQGWGFRHGVSFYVFAAPAFGFFVIQLARLFSLRRYSVTVFISLGMIILWSVSQYLEPNSRRMTNEKILKKSSVLTLLEQKPLTKKNEAAEDRRYHFFASINAKNILETIEKDVHSTSPLELPLQPISVMIDNLALEAVTFFYSKRLMRISSMPILSCYHLKGVLRADIKQDSLSKPIVRSFIVDDDGMPVRATLVYEGVFHTELKKRGVQYFVETGHIEGLSGYLASAPAFDFLGKSQSGKDVWTIWKLDVDKLSSVQYGFIDKVYDTRGENYENISHASYLMDFEAACLDTLQ